MRYLATTLATDWQDPSRAQAWAERVLKRLLPSANPDYEGRLTRVRLWWVELDEAGVPQRELGLDAHGAPVVGAPVGENLGFWLDEAMVFDEANSTALTPDEFEMAWQRFTSR